jgi:hypothetical protein
MSLRETLCDPMRSLRTIIRRAFHRLDERFQLAAENVLLRWQLEMLIAENPELLEAPDFQRLPNWTHLRRRALRRRAKAQR